MCTYRHRVGRSLISYILVDGDGPSLMGSQPKSECLGDTSGVDEVLKGIGSKLNLIDFPRESFHQSNKFSPWAAPIVPVLKQNGIKV